MHLSGEVQQVIVLVIAAAVVAGLFIEKLKPAVIFFGAALLFVLSGIVSMNDFLLCFTNPSILSIFLLIFITNSLKENFNLLEWIDIFFKKARTLRGFTWRMTSGVALVSAVINNTPLVALMIPYVHAWARKHKIAPSRILMSLSFSAMLGGMITLIGTSTNLVLNGLITSKGDPGLRFTDFLFLGLLVTITGILFMYFIGYRLLPDRKDAGYLSPPQYSDTAHTSGPASYFSHHGTTHFDRKATPAFVMAETAVGQHVPEPFYERAAVNGSSEKYDVVGQSIDFRGNFTEAVVPVHSALIGRSVKTLQFRSHYDAKVVSIYRKGEELGENVQDIPLRQGDLLLLAPGENFEEIVRKNPGLYASATEKAPRRKASWMQKRLFLIALGGMLLLLIAGVVTLFTGLLLLATVLVFGKILTIAEIKAHFDIELLIILAASLTFSKALIETGAATTIASAMMSAFNGGGAISLLTGIFLLTLLLTSFITHVATISIVFPIAYALCHGAGLDPVPFYVAIAFAASASFHSPFSYQTNLMVLGPANYRLKDFIRAGLPLTVLYSIISITFIVFYYKM